MPVSVFSMTQDEDEHTKLTLIGSGGLGGIPALSSSGRLDVCFLKCAFVRRMPYGYQTTAYLAVAVSAMLCLVIVVVVERSASGAQPVYCYLEKRRCLKNSDEDTEDTEADGGNTESDVALALTPLMRTQLRHNQHTRTGATRLSWTCLENGIT